MAFKKIQAHLDEKGILHIDSLPSVNRGENISVGVEVTVSPEFLACQPQDVVYFVEYKSADNKKYVSHSMQIVDQKLTCDVQNSVLCCAGEAQMQVVAVQSDGDYIFKSQIATFFVGESINASNKQFFSNDFLAEANRLLQQIEGAKQQAQDATSQLLTLVQQVQAKLDNGDFIGKKGDKGDDGKTPTLQILDGDLFANYD